jgi:Tfp pilus assembly protein PilF
LGEGRGEGWAAALLLSCLCTFAQAAPFTPANDAEIVERLPLATDPAARRVESLRRQLAARPGDTALAVEVARRYFELAMAQGDPRLVGYAQAALAPLKGKADQDGGYWLVQGLVQQYSHDFEAALASLARSAQLAPQSAEPLAWRAAIFMVQARYSEARAECEKLAALAEPLLATGCLAYVQASTGELQPAYDSLAAAAAGAPAAAPELRLWAQTRLAEMAVRLQRPEVAEAHFKTALALGITDQFLLGAYADFLLARQRAPEVLQLLAGWERSDVLLLRMALAARAISHPRAAEWVSQLQQRFNEAARRGDKLHEQEAARFELELQGHAGPALELARSNYSKQKEPRDAEILMRAALAALQSAPAQPALDWLRTSRYEDPVLQDLAQQLEARKAKK